jgi:CheY-like chemotaxis protein
MKILIAEDDPVSCRILTANLKSWGHEVVITKNGRAHARDFGLDDAGFGWR